MFGVQGFVRRGDPVEGGGEATQGSGSLVGGRPLMLVGDMARCETHGGAFPAVEGYDGLTIDGRSVVLHRHRLGCGCRMLSTCNDMWGHAPVPSTRYTDARSYAPAAPAPSTPVERFAETARPSDAGLTLRIGLFFDGTNNNASNTALGDACREDEAEALQACRPYMLERGSSYQNGVTNVARLFELYRVTQPGDDPGAAGDYFIRLYIDGIGTTAGEPDTLMPGQALGVGRTGIAARVEDAIASVREQATRVARRSEHARIAAIEFEIFGFSRGAAAARHAVNLINRKEHGPLGTALASLQARFAPGFDWSRDVRVGFVGLFDTVVATGGLTDGLSVRDHDDQGVEVFLSGDCARQVVHLVARDEMRANFALTSAAPHREIVLPGVHSDIGGSYRDDHEGPLWLMRPVSSDEGVVRAGDAADSPDLRRNSMAYRFASLRLSEWKQRLCIDDPAQLGIDSWTWLQHRKIPGQLTPETRRHVYATVKLDRPIRWEYQLIPLRLMHKLAQEAGVRWEQSPDDMPAMALPDELKAIAENLLSGGALTDADEALLRRKYLHQSANWNAEFLRKLGPGGLSVDLVYVSRPTPTLQRDVRPNQ